MWNARLQARGRDLMNALLEAGDQYNLDGNLGYTPQEIAFARKR